MVGQLTVVQMTFCQKARSHFFKITFSEDDVNSEFRERDFLLFPVSTEIGQNEVDVAPESVGWRRSDRRRLHRLRRDHFLLGDIVVGVVVVAVGVVVDVVFGHLLDLFFNLLTFMRQLKLENRASTSFI